MIRRPPRSTLFLYTTFFLFFFKDTPPTEIYTLALHDALPISGGVDGGLTVSKVGAYGTLTVTKSTGAYSYVPDATAINALSANTSESFSVTASDGILADTKDRNSTRPNSNHTPISYAASCFNH